MVVFLLVKYGFHVGKSTIHGSYGYENNEGNDRHTGECKQILFFLMFG